jgi:hypothetical protein
MTKLERELLALENRYWQAMQQKDVAAALEMTDEPCIVTGAQGVGQVDKESFETMMRNAHWDINDFKLGDNVAVRMLGRNTAIVAYSIHEELTVDGEPVIVDANDASTWVRRDGQWLCALHTEAIAGDPYGRDRTLAMAR